MMSRKLSLLSIALVAGSCSTVGTSPGLATPHALSAAGRASWQPAPQEGEAEAPRVKDTSLMAVDILVGQRSLDEDYWTPIDEQVAFGFQAAFQSQDSVVGFETGVLFSRESDSEMVQGFDVTLDAALIEIYGGVHKSFGAKDSLLRPYLGAGLTALIVAIEGDVEGEFSDTDDDASLGFYVHGGLPFQIAESFRIGIDARLVAGSDLSLFGAEGDADYTQLSAFLGFAF